MPAASPQGPHLSGGAFPLRFSPLRAMSPAGPSGQADEGGSRRDGSKHADRGGLRPVPAGPPTQGSARGGTPARTAGAAALLVLLAQAACRAPDPAPSEPLRGGLCATPPAAWAPREPASQMRVAEYEVGGGTGAPASLAVYHFEGAGGTVEQNFARWAAQFTTPEGGPVEPRMLAAPDRGGLRIHELSVEGTYVAEVRPGAEERHHEPGWALRAAVVETPAGPYYVKLVGPEATVRAAEPDWNRYLASFAFDGAR